MPPANDSTHTRELLSRLDQDDGLALEQLLESQRNYLRRLVDLRLQDALRGRVDPSDVVQETLLVISNRVGEFVERRPTSFRLWIRRKAIERLVELNRKHYAGKRSVRREVTLSDASSMAVARHFVPRSPSQVIQQKEMAACARQAMETLSEVDREVLLLRHVEELTNAEVAELLEINPEAASRRYGRAIRRLSEKLVDLGS